MPDYS